ncbi:MAG: gamma-butyrobetaine hydroxylase-like domain-containing protein [Alphaproteobacteria bacterium]
MAEAPRPTNIKYISDARSLELTFETGEQFSLSAELLRVESPSAEVQGHGPSQKQIVRDKQAVTITAIEPVGNYAVRLIFDDGHDSGLYSWQWLYDLATHADERWAAYQNAL